MFIGLYIFIPNTKVKLKHAWFPGILAGTAFQAFQFFYVNSQIWVSNYNAIYGSFAAIPMFLLWTQISWTICLFGAEMSYVSQNLVRSISEKKVQISAADIMISFAPLYFQPSARVLQKKRHLTLQKK